MGIVPNGQFVQSDSENPDFAIHECLIKQLARQMEWEPRAVGVHTVLGHAIKFAEEI